jgi:hypothetical protein
MLRGAEGTVLPAGGVAGTDVATVLGFDDEQALVSTTSAAAAIQRIVGAPRVVDGGFMDGGRPAVA